MGKAGHTNVADSSHSGDPFRDCRHLSKYSSADFDWAFHGAKQNRTCKGAKRKPKQDAQRWQQDRIYAEILARSINITYWRFGITINQGNDMSVSAENAHRILNYIRVRLLKAIFGNNYRRKGAEIHFMQFTQGSRDKGNQHFHVLMGIEGNHDWSDQKIADTINEIERNRPKRTWEKAAHVDWDWEKGNAFHRYVAREMKLNTDSYTIF